MLAHEVHRMIQNSLPRIYTRFERKSHLQGSMDTAECLGINYHLNLTSTILGLANVGSATCNVLWFWEFPQCKKI